MVFSALILLLLAASASGTIQNLAKSQLLTDYVTKTGARCLDGTPQRYWLRQAAPGSANATKYYIHIMGG